MQNFLTKIFKQLYYIFLIPLLSIYSEINAQSLMLLRFKNHTNYVTIEEGTTLGVVGESGCGKSTLGRLILRLLDSTEGEVYYKGDNILAYDKHKMRMMRQKMQIIFQDPYESLNPRASVGEIISEALIVNKLYRSKTELDDKIYELMETVGLAERLINSYPHELDGGRRQRIGIASTAVLS